MVALATVSCGLLDKNGIGACPDSDAAWIGKDEASDGGDVVASESGFSVYAVGKKPHKQEQAYVGVLLENKSNDIATNVVLSYQIVDENGDPALHEQHDNYFTETVPFISLKGQMGVGGRYLITVL